MHSWGSHGIVLVLWISPTLWSGGCASNLWPRSGIGQISENLEIWGPGNPEIWNPTNTTTEQFSKSKAQNVGKVWISRNKNLGSMWCHPRPFFPWTGNMQNIYLYITSLASLRGPRTSGPPMRETSPFWHLGAPSGTHVGLLSAPRASFLCFP